MGGGAFVVTLFAKFDVIDLFEVTWFVVGCESCLYVVGFVERAQWTIWWYKCHARLVNVRCADGGGGIHDGQDGC
jgi:hypothetical protein